MSENSKKPATVEPKRINIPWFPKPRSSINENSRSAYVVNGIEYKSCLDACCACCTGDLQIPCGPYMCMTCGTGVIGRCTCFCIFIPNCIIGCLWGIIKTLTCGKIGNGCELYTAKE